MVPHISQRWVYSPISMWEILALSGWTAVGLRHRPPDSHSSLCPLHCGTMIVYFQTCFSRWRHNHQFFSLGFGEFTCELAKCTKWFTWNLEHIHVVDHRFPVASNAFLSIFVKPRYKNVIPYTRCALSCGSIMKTIASQTSGNILVLHLGM